MVLVLILLWGPRRHRDVEKVLTQCTYQTPSDRTFPACTRGDFKWQRVRLVSPLHQVGRSQGFQDLVCKPGRSVPLHCFLVKVTTWEYKVQGRSWTELCPGCPPPPLCAGPRSRCACSELLRGPTFTLLSVGTEIVIILPLPRGPQKARRSRCERSPALCFAETQINRRVFCLPAELLAFLGYRIFLIFL